MTETLPKTMTDITLREFDHHDIAAASQLWRTQPGIGLSGADEPEQLAGFLLRNPSTNFVAISDGNVVGTLLAGHDGRRGYLYHLAVASTHQRRGIARQLVRATLAALRRANIVRCHAHVYADNATGRSFWTSIGAIERIDLMVYSLPTDTAV